MSFELKPHLMVSPKKPGHQQKYDFIWCSTFSISTNELQGCWQSLPVFEWRRLVVKDKNCFWNVILLWRARFGDPHLQRNKKLCIESPHEKASSSIMMPLSRWEMLTLWNAWMLKDVWSIGCYQWVDSMLTRLSLIIRWEALQMWCPLTNLSSITLTNQCSDTSFIAVE